MRTTLATAVACLLGVGISTAHDAQAAVKQDTTIPAQGLGPALKQLANERDIQLVYRSEVVGDHQTSGAVGELTIDEALTRLLKGTGLTYQYIDDRAITIVLMDSRSSPQHSGLSTQASSDGVWQRFRLAQAEQGASPSRSVSAESLERRVTLEEIIVTAQKRTESIMDVPMSITAIDAYAIEQRGISSFEEYLRAVPAVAYTDRGPGQTTIAIRGISPSTFPTVGVYFGDVPLTGLSFTGAGATSADIKLMDIERVEVLRGPQGTLYGASSMAGAIREIPVAPKLDRAEARLSVGYSSTAGFGGSNNELKGILNLPIVKDRLALRAVAYHIDKSAYIRNEAGNDPSLQASAAYFGASGLAANRDVGASTVNGGRVSMLWNPVDSLRIGATYLRQSDGQDERALAQRGLGEYQLAAYRHRPIDASPLATLEGGDAVEVETEIKNLTIEYELPWGTFFSSTASVDQDNRRLWDIGPLFPSNGFTPPVPQDSLTSASATTEELRFTSRFSGPLQVVGGIYYQDTEQPSLQTTFFGGDPALNNLAYAPGAVVLHNIVIQRDVKEQALFGELSYDVTSRLKLTGGARWFDYDTFFFLGRTISANQAVRPLFSQPLEASDNGTTYKASVEFKPTENILTYARFSQGFRTGFPKDTSLTQSMCDLDRDGIIDGTQISAVDPLIKSDTVDAYEVGARARLLEGRAAIGVSGYRNDWTDLPITIGPFASCPTIQTAFNGGEVRINGFELEGAVNLLNALRIDLGIGYAKAEFANSTSLGREGVELPGNPRWNGSLAAEYRLNLAGQPAFVRADYAYYGDWYTGSDRTGQKFDAYGILNMSAGTTFDRFDVRLFVSNVTDKYALTQNDGLFITSAFPVRPRTVGLTLGVSF